MIRLKDWEYDLIRFEVSQGVEMISQSRVLSYMMVIGYFQGLNEYKPLVDILVEAVIEK